MWRDMGEGKMANTSKNKRECGEEGLRVKGTLQTLAWEVKETRTTLALWKGIWRGEAWLKGSMVRNGID